MAVTETEPPRRLVVTTTIAASAYQFMCGQLRWLAGHGFEVHLVSSPGPYLERSGAREGVTTHPLPMRREISVVADLLSLLRWLGLLHRLRPAVVSYGTPKAGLVAGLAAAALRVPRRVYVLRGLRLEGERGARRLLLGAIERLTCATAHTVVAISPSLARAAVRCRVVPGDKVVVLGRGSSNGVDASAYRPATAAERAWARAAAGIPAGAVVIGYVGRLAPDKGIACLGAAFTALRRHLPSVRLALIGEAEGCPDAERLARRSGVHRIGPVDDPVLRYAALDLLCLPTRREGFGNVILEAAACGIPAVSTRVTGTVDAVVDGETGVLVPVDDPASLRDALYQLCEDPDLRADLGAKARHRALRDFAPERIWRGLLDVYKG